MNAMKFTIKKEALLYDIENMAYVIADTGSTDHGLHRVTDICQKWNIDRVSRVLGLAYSKVNSVLSPILCIRVPQRDCDRSARVHDYIFEFRREGDYVISGSTLLKLKETIHEYMVCFTLTDWLEVTMAGAGDVWRERASLAISALTACVSSLTSRTLSRKISPI